jgi:PrcB C-terminal
VLAVALSACGGAGRPISYRNLSGQLRDYEPPRLARETFTSKAQFAEYIRHAAPGGRISVPGIDWKSREAILVASGPRSSTGYTLRVVSIRDHGGRIVLTVREHTPSIGEPVAARVTYPFVLITIPRTSHKLLLHFQGRP